MCYYPNNAEEIALLSFIGKFQYLPVNDTKYFFSSEKYYRARITKLVQKKCLKRITLKLVLDESGIKFCKFINVKITPLQTNPKYIPRLVFISHLAVFYMNCNKIQFTPSIDMKDKECFTATGRRFVGLLEISGRKYLTYHILKNHDTRYKNNVIYDMQKEQEYNNMILFIDDINRFNYNDFSFGYPHVLIIENTDENKEKLKYLHCIDWYNVVKKFYGEKIFLSEHNFCDYTDNKNKYISTFYFLDIEKINRIKTFLREHENKNIDIICSFELKELIKKQLPSAHFCVINLEDYIIKETNIYD